MAENCLAGTDIVILAGGLGTRLRAVVSDRPKVMAPVGGKPYLGWIIESLRSYGAERIILALGYMAGTIEEYVRTQHWDGLTILCSTEPEPRGTGGALRAVLPLVQSPTLLSMNGDSFTRVNLCNLVQFHRARAAQISMVLTHMAGADRYGVVETGPDGAVISFLEKPASDAASDGQFINAGIYMMKREVLEAIPTECAISLEREVFPSYCRQGLFALKGHYPFIDIGTPESYRQAEAFFSEPLPPAAERLSEGSE